MNVSSSLLLNEAGIANPEAHWLIIGGEADLALAVADQAQPMHLVWIPYDAMELAKLGNDPRIQVHHRPVEAPGPPNSFDIVLIPGMSDRDLNRRSLAIAKQTVRSIGWVVVAGANNEGVRSFLSDAHQMFSDPFYSDYRSKHRIATFEGIELTEQPPEWSSTAGIQPGSWIDTGVFLAGQKVMHATTSGVFSANGVDEGTRMLLEHFDVQPGQHVLDVGTGSGIIGAYARAMKGIVTMTDSSLIAIAAARRTVVLNEFDGVHVVAGNTYEPIQQDRFDVIVSNPPFHKGRHVDHSMSERLLSEAPAHLEPGGHLLVIANSFLSYGKQMKRHFRDVETVASNRRYHLIGASTPLT
ncbi:MAG: methyltransferase [Thermomicrobiales bacterium]